MQISEIKYTFVDFEVEPVKRTHPELKFFSVTAKCVEDGSKVRMEAYATNGFYNNLGDAAFKEYLLNKAKEDFASMPNIRAIAD